MSDWSAFPLVTPEQDAPAADAKPDPWAAFPKVESDPLGVPKQAGIGVARAVIGAPGLIGDLQDYASKAGDWLKDHVSVPQTAIADWLNGPGTEKYKHPPIVSRGDVPIELKAPSSADIEGQVSKVTGPFREAQDQTEADAETVGNFATNVVMPGGWIKKGLQVAIPAAATVITAHYTDNNPYAKALVGFLTGGATAYGASKVGAQSMDQFLRSKLPAFVEPQHIDEAGQLIARSGGKLTWPEALSQVTGRPVLTDTQRILESDPRSRDAMAGFMADRPQVMQDTARSSIDANAGPAARDPYAIGPAAQDAADATVKQRQADINTATRPYYQAAETQRVGPAVGGAIAADPLYAQTLEEVRSKPELNRKIENMPDDSVGTIDVVQRRLKEKADNAEVPGEASTSNLAATNFQDARTAPLAAADTVTGSRPGVPGSYETARLAQSYLRQNYLEPMMAGPIGKIAKSDGQTQSVINQLFSDQPLANSEKQIGEAISQIEARRPGLGQQIVRQYLEGTLNSSAKALQSGGNSYVGARLWKELVGDPQKLKNMQAAVEALPGGKTNWQGLRSMLEIMEATGKRQPKGSLTAFNAKELPGMTSAGLLETASQITNVGKWQRAANDMYTKWSQGKNFDKLAELFTDPKSGAVFDRIAKMPRGRVQNDWAEGGRFDALIGRLLSQGNVATTGLRPSAPTDQSR